MSNENKPGYSISGVEKALNGTINFIFYYRLILVFASLIFLCYSCWVVWHGSLPGEKYKNISILFGLGSVAIGIFYSILNYENNHIKHKADIKKAKLALSFSSVSEWHQPTMVANLKITKQLYDQHKHFINDNKGREFFDILEQDEDGRSALVSILNYFECISLAVEMHLLDSDYIKSAMGGVARFYINYYGFYINYRRSVNNSPTMWIHFTNMVNKWDQE